MNKIYGRELKGIYIRDVKDRPSHRQAIGYFKYTYNKLGICQAELLSMLRTKSLKEINEEFDNKQGNVQEFEPPHPNTYFSNDKTKGISAPHSPECLHDNMVGKRTGPWCKRCGRINAG